MYRAITKDIEVQVTPRFLSERSSPENGYYFWAYTIEITRPIRLIRTFLFVAANNIHALTWLARKGTNIWLIPKALAVPDPAAPTAVSAAEFYDTAIPLGETLQASDTIRAVLEHAGHPTT